MITEAEKEEYRKHMDAVVGVFSSLNIPGHIALQAFATAVGTIHGFMAKHPNVCGSDLGDTMEESNAPRDNLN